MCRFIGVSAYANYLNEIVLIWMNPYLIECFFFLFFLSNSDKFLGVSDPSTVLRLILPFIFASDKSVDEYSTCIRLIVGLVLWLVLFWSTSHSHCRSASCLLHHHSHTKSTNRSTVSRNRILFMCSFPNGIQLISVWWWSYRWCICHWCICIAFTLTMDHIRWILPDRWWLSHRKWHCWPSAFTMDLPATKPN